MLGGQRNLEPGRSGLAAGRLSPWRFLFCLLIALFAGHVAMPIAGAGERKGVIAHLRPGDNYVGWISDSRPVQSLFDELP